MSIYPDEGPAESVTHWSNTIAKPSHSKDMTVPVRPVVGETDVHGGAEIRYKH